MVFRPMLASALCLVLASCGGGSSGSGSTAQTTPPVVVAPAPSPSPSPTPSPTPTPAPVTPQKVGDGKIVVVSEGSSSAVDFPSSHTGMYSVSRGGMEWYGLAVGGSSLETMVSRQAAVLAAKPDLVSIYIGSNDIAITSKFPTVDSFIAQLKAYVDPIRASGARVVICTLLPKQTADTAGSARFNVIRKEFNEKIRKAEWVDGIADFGASTIIGFDEAPYNLVLFQSDGQHLTKVGHENAYVLYRPVMDKLFADVR